MRQLLVTASVVPSSPIHVILMKEALSSSETSVLTRATRRNIPEDVILHSHLRENLKSYILSMLQMSCKEQCSPHDQLSRTPRTYVRSRMSDYSASLFVCYIVFDNSNHGFGIICKSILHGRVLKTEHMFQRLKDNRLQVFYLKKLRKDNN
jgi:hypothetical protein